jgi:hypothetical protein
MVQNYFPGNGENWKKETLLHTVTTYAQINYELSAFLKRFALAHSE